MILFHRGRAGAPLPNDSSARHKSSYAFRHDSRSKWRRQFFFLLFSGILVGLTQAGETNDLDTGNASGSANTAGALRWSPTLRTSLEAVKQALTLADEESALVAETARRDERQVLAEAARKASIDPMAVAQPLPEAEAVELGARAESATPRRWRYSVSLSLREVYDDNINLSQIDPKEDFYTTIEPTINVGIGDLDANFVALTYAPNAYIFADHSENNALQHIITLAAQYRFPRLTLNLTQDIQLLDGTGLDTATGTGGTFTRTNLDVAGRTRLNIFNTRLDANYSLTGKTFLTGGLGYSVSDYPTLLSSSVLSGNVYFNYTYSPKLAIGAGLTGGYDAVDEPSENQTFEQLNVRASYELTGKVSATVSAGFEFRQATDSDSSDNGSPVFDGTLFYQPFDGTSLALTFSRRTLNSATLASQDFHSTSVILSGRQRFLQKLFFGLSLGYENSSYFSTISGIDSNRTDDYYFVQASLDLNVTHFWTLGIYYFYRESDSSLAGFSFDDNQLGLRTSLTF